MRTMSFWLLFSEFLVAIGTGLALLNNLASMTVALGGVKGGQVVFVSLFSVANASGECCALHTSMYAEVRMLQPGHGQGCVPTAQIRAAALAPLVQH